MYHATQPSLFVQIELYLEILLQSMLCNHSLSPELKPINARACEYLHLIVNSQHTPRQRFWTVSL